MRDKFLTEAMGECRHKMKKVNGLYCCDKCSDEDMIELPFNNFGTWDGFGKLWTWAKEQDWWNDFFCSSCHESTQWFELMIDPNTFANSVQSYLECNKL